MRRMVGSEKRNEKISVQPLRVWNRNVFLLWRKRRAHGSHVEDWRKCLAAD